MSLTFSLRGLRHGLGYAPQYVHFFFAQSRTVEQLVQARHQLFRGLRVEKAYVSQRLLPMRQQTGDLRGIGLHSRRDSILYREAAER